MNQHGTALEWHGIGILLVGPPGSGKSELALKLIEQGAILIADDQVLLSGTTASCPPVIKGKLHHRTQGFIDLPHKPTTTLGVIFRSDRKAFKLSQPPALDLPLITLDFLQDDAVFLVTKHLSAFDTRRPSA